MDWFKDVTGDIITKSDATVAAFLVASRFAKVYLRNALAQVGFLKNIGIGQAGAPADVFTEAMMDIVAFKIIKKNAPVDGVVPGIL